MQEVRQHTYWVYILAGRKNGTLYVGITSRLRHRLWEHRQHLREGFSAKYNVPQLVYFEKFRDVRSAIHREKQIKGGSRKKKIELIERENPDWLDLSNGWFGPI
jgi:putative endonuclease